MTRQEKQLLLVDLCARLPYGVIGAVPHYDENGEVVLLQGKITGFNEGQIKFEYLPDCTDDIGAYNWFDIDLVKPYLRPMSSMTEHTLQRDKDGFLIGEVSDLDVYLPFEVHDNEDDTWALIEDGSALVDWSGDIDTKPRYDRIRTMEQVLSNSENIGKDLKGGEE